METTEESRRRALDRLAGRAARRGFAIAYDLLGDRAEAEDAVQEALARACERHGELRDPAALDGWFYRVVTNLCLKGLRRRRVRAAFARVTLRAAEPAPSAAGGDVERLLRAVERLSPHQRAAVVLRYGHELSVEEIAAMLGVGAGTVKTHLVRGLRRLRALLNRGEP